MSALLQEPLTVRVSDRIDETKLNVKHAFPRKIFDVKIERF